MRFLKIISIVNIIKRKTCQNLRCVEGFFDGKLENADLEIMKEKTHNHFR